MSAPTISDVARVARVGKTSVSRYLNGETDALSPALKERIEAAITSLSYRPNQMARGLKRGRTRLIGILVADLQNPYSVSVMQGIENACRESGLMPMICNAGNEVAVESRYLDLMQTYRAEGVIVNPVGMLDSTLQTIAEGGLPMVMLDRTVDGVACDSIGLDNKAATHLIVDHLVAAEFTSLYFVTETFASVSSRREREAAFTSRAKKHGVTATTITVDLSDSLSIDAAVSALHQSLASHRSPASMAVLSGNGQTMLALMIALKSHPLRGVGLATFDDPEWIGLAEPGITALRQPTFSMGETAVRLLAERIDEQTTANRRPVREVTFDATLIARCSTSRPFVQR